MTFVRLVFVTVVASLLIVAPHPAFEAITAHPHAQARTPRATLTNAPALLLPGGVDSNSPIVWDLEDGQRRMFAFTSYSGVPSMASGNDVGRLGAPTEIVINPHPGHGVWMEAIVTDEVGTWYGFYHNEWPATRCGRDDVMVARIGGARSTDRGRTWEDLGPVIQAMQNATACFGGLGASTSVTLSSSGSTEGSSFGRLGVATARAGLASVSPSRMRNL
jgi:hypothetical protein